MVSAALTVSAGKRMKARHVEGRLVAPNCGFGNAAFWGWSALCSVSRLLNDGRQFAIIIYNGSDDKQWLEK